MGSADAEVYNTNKDFADIRNSIEVTLSSKVIETKRACQCGINDVNDTRSQPAHKALVKEVTCAQTS